MFAFHKPKIYRSVNGCCICKAKSSSSRFTDSKKYEPEFEKCFRINETRSGEICNACVLLVKRWKKLPIGTNRDWHHVVDGREKSLNKKMKPKNRGVKKKFPKKLKDKVIVDKIRDQLREHLRTTTNPLSGGLSDDVTVCDDSMSECSNFSLPHSRIPSPTPSVSSEDSGIQDEEDELEDETGIAKPRSGGTTVKKVGDQLKRKGKDGKGETEGGRRKLAKSTRFNALTVSSFLDMTVWKKEKICCGVIFKGPNDQVLICPKLLRPCRKNSSPNNNNLNSDHHNKRSESSVTEPDRSKSSTVFFASPTSILVDGTGTNSAHSN